MESDKSKIINAKRNLENSLGDDWIKYMQNLKMWFRQKWTKEVFDRESRIFLTRQQIIYHNQFLIEILNSVDPVKPDSNSSTRAPAYRGATSQDVVEVEVSQNNKRQKRGSDHEQIAFQPYSVYEFIKQENSLSDQANSKLNNSQLSPGCIRYAAQELFLPDNNLVLGRFLIGAWETGLVSADDMAIEMIVQATQIILKNIITQCIMLRKHYRVTADRNYYYDIGAPIKDPTVRNTVTRQKIDDDVLMLDKEIASVTFTRNTNESSLYLAACEDSSHQEPRKRISLYDLYKALLDKKVILSHSISQIAIERITAMLE